MPPIPLQFPSSSFLAEFISILLTICINTLKVELDTYIIHINFLYVIKKCNLEIIMYISTIVSRQFSVAINYI